MSLFISEVILDGVCFIYLRTYGPQITSFAVALQFCKEKQATVLLHISNLIGLTDEELNIVKGLDVWIIRNNAYADIATICLLGGDVKRLEDIYNFNPSCIYSSKFKFELENLGVEVNYRPNGATIRNVKDSQAAKTALEAEADRLFQENKQIFTVTELPDSTLVLHSYSSRVGVRQKRRLCFVCMHILSRKSPRVTRTDVIELTNAFMNDTAAQFDSIWVAPPADCVNDIGRPVDNFDSILVIRLSDCVDYVDSGAYNLDGLGLLVIQIKNNADYVSISRPDGPPPAFENILHRCHNTPTVCIVEICPTVTLKDTQPVDILREHQAIVSHRSEQKLFYSDRQMDNSWQIVEATTSTDEGLLRQTFEKALHFCGASEEAAKTQVDSVI